MFGFQNMARGTSTVIVCFDACWASETRFQLIIGLVYNQRYDTDAPGAVIFTAVSSGKYRQVVPIFLRILKLKIES